MSHHFRFFVVVNKLSPLDALSNLLVVIINKNYQYWYHGNTVKNEGIYFPKLTSKQKGEILGKSYIYGSACHRQVVACAWWSRNCDIVHSCGVGWNNIRAVASSS
jgi:hypothetical protein